MWTVVFNIMSVFMVIFMFMYIFMKIFIFVSMIMCKPIAHARVHFLAMHTHALAQVHVHVHKHGHDTGHGHRHGHKRGYGDIDKPVENFFKCCNTRPSDICLVWYQNKKKMTMVEPVQLEGGRAVQHYLVHSTDQDDGWDNDDVGIRFLNTNAQPWQLAIQEAVDKTPIKQQGTWREQQKPPPLTYIHNSYTQCWGLYLIYICCLRIFTANYRSYNIHWGYHVHTYTCILPNFNPPPGGGGVAVAAYSLALSERDWPAKIKVGQK